MDELKIKQCSQGWSTVSVGSSAGLVPLGQSRRPRGSFGYMTRALGWICVAAGVSIASCGPGRAGPRASAKASEGRASSGGPAVAAPVNAAAPLSVSPPISVAGLLASGGRTVQRKVITCPPVAAPARMLCRTATQRGEGIISRIDSVACPADRRFRMLPAANSSYDFSLRSDYGDLALIDNNGAIRQTPPGASAVAIVDGGTVALIGGSLLWVNGSCEQLPLYAGRTMGQLPDGTLVFAGAADQTLAIATRARDGAITIANVPLQPDEFTLEVSARGAFVIFQGGASNFGAAAMIHGYVGGDVVPHALFRGSASSLTLLSNPAGAPSALIQQPVLLAPGSYDQGGDTLTSVVLETNAGVRRFSQMLANSRCEYEGQWNQSARKPVFRTSGSVDQFRAPNGQRWLAYVEITGTCKYSYETSSLARHGALVAHPAPPPPRLQTTTTTTGAELVIVPFDETGFAKPLRTALPLPLVQGSIDLSVNARVSATTVTIAAGTMLLRLDVTRLPLSSGALAANPEVKKNIPGVVPVALDRDVSPFPPLRQGTMARSLPPLRATSPATTVGKCKVNRLDGGSVVGLRAAAEIQCEMMHASYLELQASTAVIRTSRYGPNGYAGEGLITVTADQNVRLPDVATIPSTRRGQPAWDQSNPRFWLTEVPNPGGPATEVFSIDPRVKGDITVAVSGQPRVSLPTWGTGNQSDYRLRSVFALAADASPLPLVTAKIDESVVVGMPVNGAYVVRAQTGKQGFAVGGAKNLGLQQRAGRTVCSEEVRHREREQFFSPTLFRTAFGVGLGYLSHRVTETVRNTAVLTVGDTSGADTYGCEWLIEARSATDEVVLATLSNKGGIERLRLGLASASAVRRDAYYAHLQVLGDGKQVHVVASMVGSMIYLRFDAQALIATQP